MDGRADRNNNKRKYQILTLLCVVVFLCCVVWVAAYMIGQGRAAAEMEAVRGAYVSGEEGGPEEISPDPAGARDPGMPEDTNREEAGADNGEGAEGADSAGEETPDPAASADPSAYGITGRTVDIAALQEEVNRDIYAWVTVPGTVIDYPVLQHPEEMDYYLEYNLDGTKGRPGCIYTQRMNAKDWTDPNTVLYGHNMRAGTMFADLHKFEDRDFFDENRYIHIYTEDGRILVYEIFAAYAAGNEHLLLTYPVYTEEGFQSYLDGIFTYTGKGCNFLEDMELTAEDKIITLSTCVYGQSDRRYLVQGVLAAEIPCAGAPEGGTP